MVDRKLALALTATFVFGSAALALGADSTVDTANGKKYKMADAVIANELSRITDAADDQVLSDGSAAAEAPQWSDISRVHVATAKTPAKLRTKMEADHPLGAADAFYGRDARPRVGQRIIFVAVEMARKLPPSAKGQLVEVGLAGVEATPVQAGTELDTLAGVETFSLSGRFKNGAMATGDTDVVGKEPGVELEDADYYNTRSGVYGFYRPKNATWYLAIPREGASAITISVRSVTGAGRVLDRVELPGGGHFIELDDPTGGFKKNAGVPALTCRAIETFSGAGGVMELSDIDSTLIRYTAGVDTSVGQKKRAELLGAATEAAGPVSVLLTEVGSEVEPTTVEGELSVVPDGNAVQLSFEVPAGQWTFALADEIRTPAGELVVAAGSLVGPAGVLTGPGLDGLAAGELSCLSSEAGDGAVAATTDDGEEPPATEDADPETDEAPSGDAIEDGEEPDA
jgi:hypothetical protein